MQLRLWHHDTLLPDMALVFLSLLLRERTRPLLLLLLIAQHAGVRELRITEIIVREHVRRCLRGRAAHAAAALLMIRAMNRDCGLLGARFVC